MINVCAMVCLVIDYQNAFLWYLKNLGNCMYFPQKKNHDLACMKTVTYISSHSTRIGLLKPNMQCLFTICQKYCYYHSLKCHNFDEISITGYTWNLCCSQWRGAPKCHFCYSFVADIITNFAEINVFYCYCCYCYYHCCCYYYHYHCSSFYHHHHHRHHHHHHHFIL